MPPSRSGNPLMFFVFLLIAYTAVSLIEGIATTAFNGVFLNYTESQLGGDLAANLESLGVSSLEEYGAIMFREGIVCLVTGTLTLITAVLCIKLVHNRLAVVLCVAASLSVIAGLPFMTPEMMRLEFVSVILQVMIGLLVARGIRMGRRFFKS